MDKDDAANISDGARPVRRRARRAGQWFLWLLGPAVVLAGAAWFVLTNGRYESTDNAYLHADIIRIAPEVSGRVVTVAVRENQRVHAGDVLFRIDAEAFELAVAELQAQAVAIGQYLDSSRDSYAAALADLDARRADLKHAQQQLQRVADLRARGVVSAQVLDDAATAVDTAAADRDAAAAEAAKAKTLLGGDADAPARELAAYKVVQARLDKAQLELAHTVVRAPEDGVIGSESLQVGDYATVGQPLMPLVTDNIWIDANFKETDMTWVHPGQHATVRVDTYPGREWRAAVASISPASSAQFSVLPAQNATGNWVKVVQRIPVRLELAAPPDGERLLRAGMSAVVEIDTGSGHTLADRWFGDRPRAATQLARHRGAGQ